jgi:hypothetical protein
VSNPILEKFAWSGLAGMALVLAGCASPESMNANNPAPTSVAAAPVVPYECTQTKGQVRVVLLKVERATIFTSDNVQDAKPGKIYPVPTVGIVYRIEALGNEPIKNWNITTEEVKVGNQRVGDNQKMPPNITPGSNASIGPLGDEPRGVPVLDAERSTIEQIYVRCGPVPSGMATLTLNTGFNDKTETFVFSNVPLN